MSTIHRTAPESQVRRPASADTAPAGQPLDAPRFRALRAVTGLLRISLGWIFLWAFLDKMFALGFSTGRDAKTGIVDRFGDAAWLNGGSPTKGFLSFGTKGPLADFYAGFAGAAWADWLFMAGLLGIGLALVLGIGIRFAAVAGTALMVMMWSAALAPENNPFMDDHIIYALTLIVLALMGAGRFIGLGRQWEQLTVVKKHGWLK
jgi:thiosulfate dehydrogenase (quinone) large subunit